VTTPIAEFLRALDRDLRAERRLRRARIITEVRDHLTSTADDLERSGLPRVDAERLAVERFGEPGDIAGRFPSRTVRATLVESYVYAGLLVGSLLAAWGVIGLVGGALSEAVGRSRPTPSARIWRSCDRIVNDECVGGFTDHRVALWIVSGGLLLVGGLLFVAVHWLLRRRFVDDDPGSLTAWWFDIAGISTFGLIAVGLLVVGTGQTLTGDGTAWLSLSLPGGLLSLAVCLLFVRDLNSRSATV
jgi:HAAS domain-containing protein